MSLARPRRHCKRGPDATPARGLPGVRRSCPSANAGAGPGLRHRAVGDVATISAATFDLVTKRLLQTRRSGAGLRPRAAWGLVHLEGLLEKVEKTKACVGAQYAPGTLSSQRCGRN